MLRPEEEPLISPRCDIEEGHEGFSGSSEIFWHTLTFSTMKSIMDKGVTEQLGFEDLLPLPYDMDPSSCHKVMLISWQAQLTNDCSDPSLLKAIFGAYGWPYLRLAFLKVFSDCLGFAGPLLLNRLINFLEKGSGSTEGYVIAASLGLTSLLNLAGRSKFSEGEIQTFMSVDADRTVNLCNSFNDIWSLPLQIGVALYLLYTQVDFAFVSGVTITVLLIPVNKWIAKMIARATEAMMTHKDERIRRTGELFTYIRTLKMYGWELHFMDRVIDTRSSEVAYLSKRKYLDAWCVFFWATTPAFFSLFTFGLYSLMGHALDAATVFTCLALFNTLISPLNSFPWVINGLIDAIISTGRLSRFLACRECKQEEAMMIDLMSRSCPSLQVGCSLEDKAIVTCKAFFSWSSDNLDMQKFHLNDLNLCLPKGYFVAIIGEVGSGKSSLLCAILREMETHQGWVHTNGTISYVPQVPWILSGTIRENIVFGEAFNSERYADVLQACALDVDISQMAEGDMAYLGERGNNLSGGQKARLALARAMYLGRDLFLLDDVLSAVDSQVAHHVLHNAILGPLMNQQARILCTHNIEAISSADIVVVMDKGCVKLVGSPADLAISTYSAFAPRPVQDPPELVLRDKCSDSVSEASEYSFGKKCVSSSDEAQVIIETEHRKEGKVDLLVYRKYAEFSGWCIAALIFLTAVLMQGSKIGNDLWLTYWVDATRGRADSHYYFLDVLCIFCVVNSILTLLRAFTFAYGGLQATVRAHDTLLNRLINAPVYFFDRTPSGRILNRFSSDLYTIDDNLPFILNILLANFVGLVGIAIVICYLQLYYRCTSRELRRLDSVSRSPIYASFTETLDGASTIRAFQSEELFFLKFTELVTVYQRTSFSELTASLWLSLRLQFLAAFVIAYIAVLAVVGSNQDLPISMGSPGMVGLALSYAAPIVSLLGSFLTSFTETEKEIVALERVLQYMDVPQEEIGGSQSLKANWPLEGKINFQNVTLKYLPFLPPALSDVDFTIAGRTHVGVIGRTGAGKSSILNALFRLTPICRGCILVDDVNINEILGRDLRSRLAVVPQTPFLFQGSIRDNLDPYKTSSDKKLWETLEKCYVREEIERAGGLDSQINSSGMIFSVGQRQLICLARVLLRATKVLCLDECTANVDTRTAKIIHNVISNDCKEMTVITIAHRISTIMAMDDILILDQGFLVEQGCPKVLLQDERSKQVRKHAQELLNARAPLLIIMGLYRFGGSDRTRGPDDPILLNTTSGPHHGPTNQPNRGIRHQKLISPTGRNFVTGKGLDRKTTLSDI
ncbi:hypothetical protein V2J09_022594 [Rumex salicifolius]